MNRVVILTKGKFMLREMVKPRENVIALNLNQNEIECITWIANKYKLNKYLEMVTNKGQVEFLYLATSSKICC